MRNKTWLFWPIILFGGTMAEAQTPATPPLAATIKASKWQKRVLLICAPSADNALLRQQRQLLSGAKAELDARDLLVQEVVASQLSAPDQRYVQQQLAVKPGAFVVVLIGKDGGVKRRETEPLTPKQLFSTIDTMPMRRQEMRKPQ